MDRLIVNTVGQAIKDDLRITDLQLGLLGGAAFAILHGVLAIPVARLAERTSCVAIMSVALAARIGDDTTAAFAFVIVHSISLTGAYLIGGFVTDKLVKKDLRFYAWAPAVGMLLAGPAHIWGFTQTNWTAAILVLILPPACTSVRSSP